MRIVVAPDKFKGTLSAIEAADAIGSVLRRRGLDVDVAPMADGGDGTLEAFVRAGWRRHEVGIIDAHGRRRRSCIAVRGDEALVELAEVCGLATVLDLPLDPWTATTRGLGQAVLAALDLGASRITLALGGSASIDGGIGLLTELGCQVTDAEGNVVTADLRGLMRAAIVRPGAGSTRDRVVRWRVLADVVNPLVGWDGALAFAAQKGLRESDVERVDAALRRWASALAQVNGIDVADRPAAGAAGGVGACAIAVLGAEVRGGAQEVAAMIDLEARIAASDVVVTGEGRFDVTSRQGKAPGVVIDLALRHGRQVHVIAGEIAPDADRTGIASLRHNAPAGSVRRVGAAEALIHATESWVEHLRSQ